MAQALTVRLPDEAAQERRSVSEIGARTVEEWIRQNWFPQIEFRGINGERVACLKGRLEVWQAVMVARDYEDINEAAEHLSLLAEQVAGALDYATTYPTEIDDAIAGSRQGFDMLKRLLPSIERIVVSDEPLAAYEPHTSHREGLICNGE